MGDTTIEWTRGDDGTEGKTWNPTTGCEKVSPGCDRCYAETIAERFRGHPAFPIGFDLQLRPNKLNDPLRWRKPTRVFVNSMSDLFHAGIPDEFIASVFAVMAQAHWHTFQLLTKRHARMRALLNSAAFVELVGRAVDAMYDDPDDQHITPTGFPFPNVWLGVSVENQQWADIRIPALLDTPAAVRFISAEPLLGPIKLSAAWTRAKCDSDRKITAHDILGIGKWPTRDSGIDWVIVGGESGRGARPMHPAWARSFRDQCAGAGVAYFLKQWGEWTPFTRPTDSWHDREPDLYVNATDGRTADEATALAAGGDWSGVYRVGKKTAGRFLDGRTWDQFPTADAPTATATR